MFEEKVNIETATDDFERMVEAAEVDVGGMSEEELSDFEDTKRKFIRLIQIGKLTVAEDGMPTLKTGTKEVPELVFKQPYTDTIIAQGRVLNGNETAKSRAMLAEATGIPAKNISIGVKGKDFITAQRILNFFLVD